MHPVETVDLGPHIEIRRVVKSPAIVADVLPRPPSPPTIVYTSSQMHSMNQLSAEQFSPTQLQPQQRVQVIKDGRNYDKPSTMVIQQHSNCNYDGAAAKPSASSTVTSLPTIMQHSNVDSPKKDSVTRSVILNASINGNAATVNSDNSGNSNSCGSGSIVFRTPVVSSTSTPMRPPPPPPPPRVKCSSNEEPSSSIPDLGEYQSKKIFIYYFSIKSIIYTEIKYICIINSFPY